VQEYIDFLKPQVDLVCAVSHLGLRHDLEMIEATEGLDIVFGGHLHIVLNPPKVVKDKSGRDVVLVHSGAFAKYVGRLDVIVKDGEVVQHKYTLFPIDKNVPEDPIMTQLIEPYRMKLQQIIDLTSIYAYASKVMKRFEPNGKDSPLGNFVAEAMRFNAKADFGLTNSLGI